MKISFFSQPVVAPTLIQRVLQKGKAMAKLVQSKMPAMPNLPQFLQAKKVEVKKQGFCERLSAFFAKKPVEQPKPKFSKLAIAGGVAAGAVVLGAAGFGLHKAGLIDLKGITKFFKNEPLLSGNPIKDCIKLKEAVQDHLTTTAPRAAEALSNGANGIPFETNQTTIKRSGAVLSAVAVVQATTAAAAVAMARSVAANAAQGISL